MVPTTKTGAVACTFLRLFCVSPARRASTDGAIRASVDLAREHRGAGHKRPKSRHAWLWVTIAVTVRGPSVQLFSAYVQLASGTHRLPARSLQLPPW